MVRNISQKDRTANDCKSRKSQSVEVLQIQKLATQGYDIFFIKPILHIESSTFQLQTLPKI